MSGICQKILGMPKSNNAFPWVSAHISGFNIGAPNEYACNILQWSYRILRAITAIQEINALREAYSY